MVSHITSETELIHLLLRPLIALFFDSYLKFLTQNEGL